MMSVGESAKDLFRRWQSGDQAAAGELYQRYAQRLCALAGAQIGSRLGRRVGPDDIVQSVFRTFFRRAATGELSIDHSGSLWQLLVRITLNKVSRQRERHHAGKRDLGIEVYVNGEQVCPEAVAHEPTAAEAAVLADAVQAVIAHLKSPEPEIFQLGLQGYSTSQIAARVGCSRWTVRQVLDRIGHRPSQLLKNDSGR